MKICYHSFLDALVSFHVSSSSFLSFPPFNILEFYTWRSSFLNNNASVLVKSFSLTELTCNEIIPPKIELRSSTKLVVGDVFLTLEGAPALEEALWATSGARLS